MVITIIPTLLGEGCVLIKNYFFNRWLQPANVRLHSSAMQNDKAELYVRRFHSWSCRITKEIY